MKDLLAHILYISFFLVLTGYDLYCFKKGEYDSIGFCKTNRKKIIVGVIMLIVLIVGMYILRPSNVNNNLIVGILGMYVFTKNILYILIFKKTKRNNIGELLYYDILIGFVVIIWCYALR